MLPLSLGFCFAPTIRRNVTLMSLLEPPPARSLHYFPRSPPHGAQVADRTHTRQAGAKANPAISCITRHTVPSAIHGQVQWDGLPGQPQHGPLFPVMLGPHFRFWLPKEGLCCLILKGPGPEVGPC